MTTFFSDTTREAATEAILESDGALYRHKKRPQWGVAILAWDHGEVRAYQFEDGRLRKFKEGYFNLMEEVDEIRGSRDRVVKDLTRAAKSGQQNRERKELTPVAAFDAQIDLFNQMYPKGFEDPKWVKDHRGAEKGQNLKRHRDHVIEAVKESLSAERCQEMMEENPAAVVEAVFEILASTDLVALKHARLIKGLEPDENKALADAIVNLLHGDNEYRQRFRGYLRVLKDILGARPNWRFATALPALAFPQEQVCVRYSAFKRQAATVAPKNRYTRRARTRPYESFRQVAHAVRKRLQAAGHEPRDLLDVYDFVWDTLRNAALEHLDTHDD